ncbi:MAG TPA: DNA-formamidopyrimidine glycosylase family protein [Kofleriaceae bacterium]
MPEGDTIFRIAAKLAPRLTGKPLERVTTQGLVRDLAGRVVSSVTAHGKHLVIELADGTHLRAHLGMYGRFRAYARADGDAALGKLSPGRASLAITVADGVFVWVGARTIEISDRRAPRHGMALASLGPDILAPDFDAAAVAASASPSRTVADVLLDQRVSAGIGNVYKSETCFLCGIDPRSRAGAVDLPALFACARSLMLENLGSGPRTTAAPAELAGLVPDDARYFVYGRTARPCRRCATPIDCYRLGDPPRWTWSCPRCQARVD